MYIYLYDTFVKKGPYARVIKSIENRLTDMELTGKIIRLAQFSNPKAILHDEMRNGAKTAIVVGDENSFARVLTRCADVDMVFGWVPVGRQIEMSKHLGIPYGAEACSIISARRVLDLDVMQVNDRYAIAELHIPLSKVWLAMDGKYAMGPTSDAIQVGVCNLRSLDWCKSFFKKNTHPQDRKLEVFIRTLKKEQTKRKKIFSSSYDPMTVLPFEKMTVYGKKPFELFIDGQRSKETRVQVQLAPHRVSVITGKQRAFI